MLARIGRPWLLGARHPQLAIRVQKPYVRLRFGQTDLNGLQRAGWLGGYLRTNRTMIVAGRLVSVAWRGIQSSGICLQLPDACHQDCRAGLDALGCVQR